MYLSAILAGFVTGAGLIMAIGAQNAFILRQGIQRNFVWLVVAICSLGDIVLIFSGVAGMGHLVRTWPVILPVLRFAGAAFLAIYGLMAARRAIIGADALKPANESAGSRKKVLLTCMAFTFLNPHVYLDTMVLVGSLSTHYAGAGKWMFGLGACIASVVWFTALTFGARFLQPIFRKPAAWQLLDAATALFMLFLSAVLIFNF
ncbi:LysE family transporter [Aristophania vespae]|uniref:LysE family transporter n=1 Tax=Aristophania vespae TaxID=2697033 RepID=A0A6P1NDM4_9PROT|nr:LysE/ArgO family amino acid transporter [Aristophania vespae]QHI95579.1 LysE family transporter [Aristophania vespae]UMM63243.1 Arginine exporter protein ArgO [Aristophania vespae]